MFKTLGFSQEQIENRFGFFVNAFNFGTPPHGGIALGLDRFAMLLANTDNIKRRYSLSQGAECKLPYDRSSPEWWRTDSLKSLQSN